MKKYISSACVLLSSVFATHPTFADNPQVVPNTGVHFVFCSLTQDNGCAQIAIWSDQPSLTKPAVLWGTSHTEQGLSSTQDAQWWVLNLVSGITQVSNLCYTKDPDPLPLCQKFTSYSSTNWKTDTDYLAAESAGNVVPYAIFGDGTYYKIKINIPDHGSELTPFFYLNYNQPPTPWPSLAKPGVTAQICYQQLDPSALPSNARLIQAAYTVGNNDNSQYKFASINDMVAALKNDGFTDENFNQPSFNCN